MHDTFMITRENMFDGILEASPSFTPIWEAFCAEWEDEGDDLPLYLALVGLARHMVGLMEQGRKSELHALFSTIESWQLQGNHYVREAAVIGILEDLSNSNLHTKTSPDDFHDYLLPESQKSWDQLLAFWGDASPKRHKTTLNAKTIRKALAWITTLAAIFSSAILYIALQHNPQGEFINNTGSADLLNVSILAISEFTFAFLAMSALFFFPLTLLHIYRRWYGESQRKWR